MDNTTYPPALDVVADLTERCDQCGAAAKLTVTLDSSSLAFCGHHANRHVDAILRIAVQVRVLADFPWSGVTASGRFS
jgi:hypothetical protein